MTIQANPIALWCHALTNREWNEKSSIEKAAHTSIKDDLGKTRSCVRQDGADQHDMSLNASLPEPQKRAAIRRLKGDDREASNRVDRSHSNVQKLDRRSNQLESLTLG